jgi:hypothetical protein
MKMGVPESCLECKVATDKSGLGMVKAETDTARKRAKRAWSFKAVIFVVALGEVEKVSREWWISSALFVLDRCKGGALLLLLLEGILIHCRARCRLRSLLLDVFLMIDDSFYYVIGRLTQSIKKLKRPKSKNYNSLSRNAQPQ